ncbi:PepSY domain-containing protein [Sphaerotilus sp.]|uniref:PepSY domain-containing protein n=1 Tax=Sphaerotilus sp. TaxID=2093942 RepID=UPI002ACDDBA2|nr:PepSY domain-containing protein [Sphaerotilus sp.]MDZ7855833.1 PepSY domain-containing protein [Sphaerotilus sp.]
MDKPRLSLGSVRGWHLWVSIALSLPILIVALTAIFITHGKSLGLKEIQVNAGWLPGMGAGKAEQAELRAYWTAPDGVQWLGTKTGLYRVRGEQVERVEDLGRADVRALQAMGSHLVVATTKGLYRVAVDAGSGERVARGDFWSLAVGPQGLLAVGKDDALLLSADGGATWSEHAPGLAASDRVAAGMGSTASDGAVPLSKLVLDLHTGKAFLGKQYEWLWIDVIGATMALLTITGLLMWWRGQRRKAAALLAQAQSQVQSALEPAAVVPPSARPA